MRLIDADALELRVEKFEQLTGMKLDIMHDFVGSAPAVDAVSVVRCKECKHRPVKEDADGENYGFNIVTPERSSLCPCIVEDGWYSWMPEDNFFCRYGEREDEQ